MIGLGYKLARPALFSLTEPEAAHRLTLRALAAGVVPPCGVPADPRLSVDAFDLRFPNPLGMAAGFDKDAEVPDALLRLGFGFTEVGTLTPKAQEGNPKPRVFRLADDHALINRLGFNNGGHAGRARLVARQGRGGIVGVNVGANKDSADRVADYVAGIERFADLASYFTINVSSPNTPGLRGLQERGALEDLLARVATARDAATERRGRRVPLLLKVAPDLDDAAVDDIVAVVTASALDGLIVSNTTLARPKLASGSAHEAGGLSGRPLFRRSTVMLARFRLRLGDRMPLVGVGGVDSGPAAFSKILAGASLVQLYTGLVYEGPALVGDILRHLGRELDRRRLPSIMAAVGLEAEAWAAIDPES
jgi:dihydroorotate dehydrogenase